jgi:D-3-phosphoglycerate dehydrogenase
MQPTYIIDFDSTIIACESLDELARLALDGRADSADRLQQLEALTRQGMAGTLPFDQALQRRLELFSASRQHIAQLTIQLRSTITPSFLRHKNWLKAQRDHMYVVSGGFEEYIKPTIALLGLRVDHVFANAFCFNEQGMICGYDSSRPTAKAGGKAVQVAALKLPHPIVAIGDGYTDYEIKAGGQADVFWAFCEHVRRPNVVAAADRIVETFDDVALYASKKSVAQRQRGAQYELLGLG